MFLLFFGFRPFWVINNAKNCIKIHHFHLQKANIFWEGAPDSSTLGKGTSWRPSTTRSVSHILKRGCAYGGGSKKILSIVAGSQLRYVDITGVVEDALMTGTKTKNVKGVTWPSCCVARLATPLAVPWQRPLHHREAHGNSALRQVNDTASSWSESPGSGGGMELGKDGVTHSRFCRRWRKWFGARRPVLVNKTCQRLSAGASACVRACFHSCCCCCCRCQCNCWDARSHEESQFFGEMKRVGGIRSPTATA